MTYKMSNKTLFFLGFAISAIVILGQCKKDDDNNSESLSDSTFTVNATGQNNWVYFSFDKGDTVQIPIRYLQMIGIFLFNDTG
jgi:hypothetical protein